MCKVTALTGENSGFGPERPGRWINGDYLRVRWIDPRAWAGCRRPRPDIDKMKKVVPYVETNRIDLFL
jgi:hypothetical protein